MTKAWRLINERGIQEAVFSRKSDLNKYLTSEYPTYSKGKRKRKMIVNKQILPGPFTIERIKY